MQLYRGLLKSCKDLSKVDLGLAESSKDQIKLQFRIHQHEKAKPTIAVLIRDGEKHLETLKELVEIRRRANSRSNDNRSVSLKFGTIPIIISVIVIYYS